MDEETPRYIKPGFFDWGLTKEYGLWILLFTCLFYVSSIAVAVLLIRRIAARTGYRKTSWTIGALPLALMAKAAWTSLSWQLTTAHYQEDYHVPALITIGMSFGSVIVVSIAVEVLYRLRMLGKP